MNRTMGWLLAVVAGVVLSSACGGIPGVSVCSEDDSPVKVVDKVTYPTQALGLKGYPSMGPEDATVTILEFTDFQCPFCYRGAGTLAQVLETYPGKVRLVVVMSPLQFHQQARPAALAALAAHRQGKFFEYQNLIWAQQGRYSEEDLVAMAETAGLDMERWKADAMSDEINQELEQHMALGAQFGVRGVPQFYINGESIRGAQPLEAFQSVIDAQLERADELLNDGVPQAELHARLSDGTLGGLYRAYIIDGTPVAP